MPLGYGGLTICGLVPIVLAPIWRKNMEIPYSAAIMCTSTSIVIFFLLGKNFIKYKIDDENWRSPAKPRCYGFIFHYLIAIGSMAMIKEENWKKFETEKVYVFIFMYSLSYFLCTAELGAILKNGICLEPEPEPDRWRSNFERLPSFRPISSIQRNITPTVSSTTVFGSSTVLSAPLLPTTVPSAPMLPDTVLLPTTVIINTDEEDTISVQNIPRQNGTECNICLHGYSNHSTIPRVLIGCGHTVCQKCIGKFERYLGDQVLCPFCRKGTKLPGGQAEQLPKNYAVLDIIQDQQS